jgi:hypothetical protein
MTPGKSFGKAHVDDKLNRQTRCDEIRGKLDLYSPGQEWSDIRLFANSGVVNAAGSGELLLSREFQEGLGRDL